MIDANPNTARYIMLGGFLGAGKTTAVGRLATHLTDRGLRVGLISNDQSSGLVDTALLRSQGFNVAEIAGGCFCCRFNSLLEAANQLSAETRPDVIIGEPVGSCTDLVATVSYPLRRIYGDRFTTAPLSVLVDPIRCARILGLESGRSFSAKVAYVYRKQLEEADLIIVNKCDRISEALSDQLVSTLKRDFTGAEVLVCSALHEIGLTDWFDRLLDGESQESPTMALDYGRYAEGEALLGWLNCTVALAAEKPFNANELLLDLTRYVAGRLASEEREIAHLKSTLDAPEALAGLCVVSVVSSDEAPHLRESLADPIRSGQLIINLRAEADPESLRRVVEDALAKIAETTYNIRVRVEHMESFRPKEPKPTHRVTVPA